MPNIKSAAKRMRQTVKRTARNRVRKEKLKKALKTFKAAVRKADAPGANPEVARAVADGLKVVTKAVDKAGTKGTLHRNAVNRRKSRLAKAANRVIRRRAGAE